MHWPQLTAGKCSVGGLCFCVRHVRCSVWGLVIFRGRAMCGSWLVGWRGGLFVSCSVVVLEGCKQLVWWLLKLKEKKASQLDCVWFLVDTNDICDDVYMLILKINPTQKKCTVYKRTYICYTVHRIGRDRDSARLNRKCRLCIHLPRFPIPWHRLCCQWPLWNRTRSMDPWRSSVQPMMIPMFWWWQGNVDILLFRKDWRVAFLSTLESKYSPALLSTTTAYILTICSVLKHRDLGGRLHL